MQGVVGLPDDLTVIQKIKALWYTSMASLYYFMFFLMYSLERKGMECLVNRDYLDIVYEGSVLRFRCCTSREVQLYSKLNKNNEYLKDCLYYGFMTNHTFTIKNMSLQNPSFIPCLRLAKLWMAANNLIASIPSYLLELLLLSVYEKYEPLNPIRGFFLFLQLLKTFDWTNDILFLNSNNSLTEERMKEIQKNLDSIKKEGKDKRFLFIVTSYDMESNSTYCMDEPALWNRLCRVASKSLSRLTSNYFSMNQEGISSIFTASEKEFDVVITIKNEYLSPTHLTRVMGEKQTNRGIVYTSKEPRNIMLNRSRLLIGYNPENVLYETVKKEIGNAGVVMMNSEYGNKILISWKPSYFLPMKMSMAGVQDCCPVWKNNEIQDEQKDNMLLVRDVFDLINRLKNQLGDLVQTFKF